MTSSSAPSAELHPRIRELLDYLDVHRREFHAAVASVPAKLREVKPGHWASCHLHDGGVTFPLRAPS